MEITELNFSEWNDTLPSRGFDIFHTAEALRVVDRHTPGTLRLYGGFRGEQPVGLFPINVHSRMGNRILTSPTPGCGIGRLGPLAMSPSPKQHKQESTNKRFVRGVLDDVDADRRLTHVRMACTIGYDDPRPFSWDDYLVTPAFTYQVDLSDIDEEALLHSFSRGLRRSIRKHEEADISIRIGGMEDAKPIYRSLVSRFKEQGMPAPTSWEYCRDLLETLADERRRIYVAEDEAGQFLSGMFILYSNDTAYFWKGGTKTTNGTEANGSPNSLLHWRIMKDILTEPKFDSVSAYDFYTANNERLADYKSKFGGTLTKYYIIESNNLPMTIGKKAYRLVSQNRIPLLSKEGIIPEAGSART